MKRLFLTIVTIVTIAFATVSYAEVVNRSVDAAADGDVRVSNVSGAISIEGWNRTTVEVTGTIGRNVKELIVERDGDNVIIKVKLPHKSRSGTDADLMIKVPRKSSLDVGTVSADIDVSEVLGEQSLHSVSGDVMSTSAGADIKAESVSGDVDISGSGDDGEIYATTVSGDVDLTNVAGEIKVVAVSGDLMIDAGGFSRARLETVNGDIDFDAELRSGGKLDIDTVNGEVDVEFAGNVSAEFDIDTFNGDIDNCFGPKPVRTSKYSPGLELEFTEGDGRGRVKISTLNGDVSICK